MRSRPATRAWNLAGAVSASLALALAWAASRIDDSAPFPPLSLGDRLIRLAPGDAATFAIDTLGKNAAQGLAVTITLVFILVGAVLPALTAARGRQRPHFAGLLLGLGLLCSSIAAPVRPSPLLPAVIAAACGAAYAVSLRWLLAASSRSAAAQDADRRRALRWIGASTMGILLGGSLIERLAAGVDRAVALKRPRTSAPMPPDDGFPRVSGLAPEITPVADHYVVDIDLQKPSIDVEAWRLRIGGLVRRPLSLSFDELQDRFEVVEQVSALTCVSNPVGGPLIGNSAWTGVRLRDVLALAGVEHGAVDVIFRGADGYDVSIPLARAMQSTALLALGQNGHPLTQEHGFPCRIRVPALYGMMNAKWIEAIDVVETDHRGYWAQRGWSPIGEIRTQSRIDAPDSARAGAATWIAGVAWAGDREISRVEVSVDNGRTWRRAQLRTPRSAVAWTQWAYRWTPERAGSVRVLCRATDGTGRRQISESGPRHPSGATGYHSVEIKVT